MLEVQADLYREYVRRERRLIRQAKQFEARHAPHAAALAWQYAEDARQQADKIHQEFHNKGISLYICGCFQDGDLQSHSCPMHG